MYDADDAEKFLCCDGGLQVKLSRLRERVAERLKQSQNTNALLTTFNEIDMTNIMALREDLQEEFLKKHGVKLGFMSCFAKASVAALQAFPVINAGTSACSPISSVCLTVCFVCRSD